MTNSQIAFDPTRRSVIEQLALGPRSVTDLARAFTLALPTFMAHLKLLERSGLVRSEKAGRIRTFTLDATVMAASEIWMAEQRRVWQTRLDQLDDYVKFLHEEERENDRQENACVQRQDRPRAGKGR